MAFNPNEHMMKLKTKDYLQVMWRLVWFREEHPDWTIDAAALEIDADHAIFKAKICDENGQLKSAGHGSESKRDFGDYIEKAETKAVGRALAMLGYGTQFAPDLDEGDRIVDSPVNRKNASDPAPETVKIPFDAKANIQTFCNIHKITMAEFLTKRGALIAGGVVPDIPSKELTREQYNELIGNIVRVYYPDDAQ